MAARYPLVLNGTTIEELQSADTLAGVDAFASGTVMLFVQTTAPSGWTKSTAHDNKALRIVSGTAGSGGTTAFTSVFASRTPAGSVNTSGLSAGAFTLTANEIPVHAHRIVGTSGTPSSTSFYTTYTTNAIAQYGWPDTGGNGMAAGVSNTGGGAAHSHSMSGSATFTGTAMDFAVQYVDAIIATKA